MKTAITITGVPQLMKNLRGYEQVAVRTMGKNSAMEMDFRKELYGGHDTSPLYE